MPITATDIKLLASERMTDTSDGGGRRTGNVIPDGVAGNIFPKVSRLDSTYGRVNLRKIFPAVQTANTDTYAGAHAIITDAPDNPKIHAALFSTGSDFDDRTAARDRIESYVIAGPESRMVLYGRQLVGQMAVLAYQRVEDTLPEVGEVFCLSKETGGVVELQQYVRVTGVTHEIRVMADGSGDFSRRIVTLQIGSPLRYEFLGPDTPSRLSAVARPTLIRRTSVADASRYSGIRPVTQAAAAGDLMVKVDSVYTPIVPTTQRETAVVNAEIAGATSAMVSANTLVPYARVGPILPVNVNSPTAIMARVQTGIAPGSLLLYMAADYDDSNPGPVVTDDGKGNIIPSADVTSGHNVLSGTVDYESGVLNIIVTWYNGGMTGRLRCSYMPAAAVAQPGHSLSLPVTLETRGTVYVQTLSPKPTAGTLFVEFRALGKWYRLSDDGTGALVGDDVAYGTGSVDHATGSVVVTLGALPDVGSSVLYSWGSPVHYTIRAGATSDAGVTVFQTIQLAELPVKPGSVSVSYLAGVTTYTATEIDGAISGGGITGTVNHATGEVKLEYTTRLPNVGTAVTVAHTQETPTNPAVPTTVSGSIAVADPTSIALATAIAAKGLTMAAVVMDTYANGHRIVNLVSNAAGNVVTTDQYINYGSIWMHIAGGQVVGTVNNATGLVSLTNGVLQATRSVYSTSPLGIGSWGTVTTTHDFVIETYSYTIRTTAASSDTVKSFAADPQTDSPLWVDLTRTLVHAVVPGSVMFSITGETHIDRNGVLYKNIQADGTGTASGTIDYGTGHANLTSWADNTALEISVGACLTQWGDWTALWASFRTAGSPVRPASLYVQATGVDGTVLTATSDEAGVITSTYARGAINHAMGSVFIEWGELVVAAGNEAEPWYLAGNVVAGMIWRPKKVAPGSIRYNCVVLSNLPLNADILGLDPVRLPSDGRVPIYRPADVVVIHNTKSYALPNPAVAGAVYNVGRTNLSELWLIDALGARVPALHYIADLAAGTVTMDAALNLTGIPQPLVARHRIEELNLLSDVQIDGQLSLTGTLQRAYDADTLVSSALLFGDMFARVANVFDQVTWTGAWSDARIGANATAEYNAVDYPLEVSNIGAVTERWRINFTSAAAFQLIGENLGVIATGSTAADLVPVNALTGLPYFTLRAAGWGAGWAVGNQLRFNTIGATAPVWIARTVLPGATLNGDSLDLQLRGDVDA